DAGRRRGQPTPAVRARPQPSPPSTTVQRTRSSGAAGHVISSVTSSGIDTAENSTYQVTCAGRYDAIAPRPRPCRTTETISSPNGTHAQIASTLPVVDRVSRPSPAPMSDHISAQNRPMPITSATDPRSAPSKPPPNNTSVAAAATSVTMQYSSPITATVANF